MTRKLLIVESPAKSRTISRYLGKDFKVVATMGHIVDLPKSRLGVDPEHGFEPDYQVIPEKKRVVSDLKKAAARADEIYLAADPDREGEAICWHLNQLLKQKNRPIYRITFNEITKSSIQKAVTQPGPINEHKFDAQQTRRIIDRLVGYQVSPLLWDKVKRGLSAGRVQTVALRIICEREKKIRAFKSEEYWTITGDFLTEQQDAITARLSFIDGKKVRTGNARAKAVIASEAEAREIESHLKNADFTIAAVTRKKRKRSPLPPFITSKLQQESARELGFSVKKTMSTAQRLYEGKDIGADEPVGLITYMRTDSTRIAADAIAEVRTFVEETFGPEEVPARPNFYKSKNSAQDAHEAIRPTSVHRTPDAMKPFLSREELALYRLIWNRFVASQMKPAILEETTVTVRADRYDFVASGMVMKEPGFTRVYNPGVAKDKLLPAVTEGAPVTVNALHAEQQFTKPPARFTEATLVKELESNGIGRPSTYASIISVIQNRAYVEIQEKKFHPTPLGELVNELLTGAFPDIFEIGYTADLENELDRIEQGERPWLDLMQHFHRKLKSDLDAAGNTMPNVKRDGLPTKETCPTCGSKLVIKSGRFGLFMACSNYPDCRYTRDLGDASDGSQTEKTCPKCGKPMILKSGRYGKFYACTGYPECEHRESVKNGTAKELDRNCPECGRQLVERKGRYGLFVACSGYPECRYIENGNRQLDMACPDCGEGRVVQRRTRRGKTFYGCSRYPDCDWVSWKRPSQGEEASTESGNEQNA